jgi:RNA polymerase subunit RPABC4/transcription elongation factor Spt4
MKQCPQCQAQVEGNANFCPNCGYSATSQNQPPPVVLVKKKRSLLPIAIIAGLIGLCALGSIGIRNENKANQSTVATTTPTNNTTTSNPATSTNTAAPAAPKEPISPMKWSEYNSVYNTRSNSTDMQKDALWKNFEGKTVAWEGTVAEVKEGTFGGLVLNIKMNSDTLTNDIALTLKESEKSKAMSLTKGKKISFVGKLKSYGGAFLPLTMDEGEIK